jgi:hypothetical protein
MSKHKVMARQCGQCLYSKSRIVPTKRAAQIMRDTARQDRDFLCHKGTLATQEAVCHGHLKATGGGQLTRIMGRLGFIKWIDPDTLQPTDAPEGFRS